MTNSYKHVVHKHTAEEHGRNCKLNTYSISIWVTVVNNEKVSSTHEGCVNVLESPLKARHIITCFFSGNETCFVVNHTDVYIPMQGHVRRNVIIYGSIVCGTMEK